MTTQPTMQNKFLTVIDESIRQWESDGTPPGLIDTFRELRAHCVKMGEREDALATTLTDTFEALTNVEFGQPASDKDVLTRSVTNRIAIWKAHQTIEDYLHNKASDVPMPTDGTWIKYDPSAQLPVMVPGRRLVVYSTMINDIGVHVRDVSQHKSCPHQAIQIIRGSSLESFAGLFATEQYPLWWIPELSLIKQAITNPDNIWFDNRVVGRDRSDIRPDEKFKVFVQNDEKYYRVYVTDQHGDVFRRASFDAIIGDIDKQHRKSVAVSRQTDTRPVVTSGHVVQVNVHGHIPGQEPRA